MWGVTNLATEDGEIRTDSPSPGKGPFIYYRWLEQVLMVLMTHCTSHALVPTMPPWLSSHALAPPFGHTLTPSITIVNSMCCMLYSPLQILHWEAFIQTSVRGPPFKTRYNVHIDLSEGYTDEYILNYLFCALNTHLVDGKGRVLDRPLSPQHMTF